MNQKYLLIDNNFLPAVPLLNKHDIQSAFGLTAGCLCPSVIPNHSYKASFDLGKLATRTSSMPLLPSSPDIDLPD